MNENIIHSHLHENQMISNKKKTIRPFINKSVEVMFEIPINDISIIVWFPNGVANNTQKSYGLNVTLTFLDLPVDKYSHSVETKTK